MTVIEKTNANSSFQSPIFVFSITHIRLFNHPYSSFQSPTCLPALGAVGRKGHRKGFKGFKGFKDKKGGEDPPFF